MTEKKRKDVVIGVKERGRVREINFYFYNLNIQGHLSHYLKI
jgi:hypothetical protein